MEQNSIIIKQLLIDEMEKGKKFTQIIRDILIQRPRLKVEPHDHHDGDDGEYFKVLEHHCMVALTSCVTSLSLMRNFEFNGHVVNGGKRKMDDHDHHDLDNHDHDDFAGGGEIKHECVQEEVTNLSTISTKDRRGCYKRRKRGDGRVEEVIQLRDDGYAWRKYGQKVILNTNHPRNYYRCTHKFDKKCPATKQVQQISENPTKYKIIYHGYHICNYNNNNHLTQSTIVINDDSSEGHSSAIVLNFDQKYQINPMLFPTSATSATTAVVKQEYNSPQSYQSASHDQTAVTEPSSSMTLVSEQSDLVSTAENCCSTSTKFYEVEEHYYSCMWSDLEVLDDVFTYESQDFGIVI